MEICPCRAAGRHRATRSPDSRFGGTPLRRPQARRVLRPLAGGAMNSSPYVPDAARRARHASRTIAVGLLVAVWSLASPADAHASLMSPEVEDAMAMYLSLLHRLLRSGRAHHPVLDGARAAGKDRAQAAPSAVRGDPHVVPAVARLRWAAVADRLAVGVHQAGRLQAGLRHRQASRLLQGARPPGAGKPHHRYPAARGRARSERRVGHRARRHSDRPGAARVAAGRERRRGAR